MLFKEASLKGSDCVGKTFTSSKCGDFVVIEYKDYDNVVVKFTATGSIVTTQLYHVKDGSIKDRMFPSICGVGIVGEKYPLENGKQSKEYTVWVGMLDRCYSTTNDTRKTYEGCEVTSSFRYFPFFKEWCHNQVGFGEKGFALDKDILVKGNKVYSPETCCFVPREINSLFVKRDKLRGEYPVGVCFHKPLNKYVSKLSAYGRSRNLGYFSSVSEAFYVYKEAKETHIKEVANKWKDQIDHRTHEALMNWEIEITD